MLSYSISVPLELVLCCPIPLAFLWNSFSLLSYSISVALELVLSYSVSVALELVLSYSISVPLELVLCCPIQLAFFWNSFCVVLFNWRSFETRFVLFN